MRGRGGRYISAEASAPGVEARRIVKARIRRARNFEAVQFVTVLGFAREKAPQAVAGEWELRSEDAIPVDVSGARSWVPRLERSPVGDRFVDNDERPPRPSASLGRALLHRLVETGPC